METLTLEEPAFMERIVFDILALLLGVGFSAVRKSRWELDEEEGVED